MGQFGIGQSVRRKEDQRFITGRGSYQDDVSLPGQLHAVFLRSPHAHAKILSIDVSAAKSMPGVHLVVSGADVSAIPPITCAVPLKNLDGSAYPNPGRPMLALDRVRHVGDPVAMVVADSVEQAKDALESIEVDYDVLPAIVDPIAAADASAVKLYDDWTSNVVHDWEAGDKAAVDAAFAKAARVVKARLVNNRIVVASIEPRGVLASYDPKDERYTIHVGTQGVMAAKRNIARHLGVQPDKIRILTADVGGSFGMKGFDFQENTLVPWAAKLLGRPVKWTSDRQEAFLSDTQGREAVADAALALDGEGRFLAIKVLSHANIGAYLSFFSLFITTMAGFRLLTGAYQIPAAYVRVKSVVTNTVWVDAYRGAGRPECAYILERLVDQAGLETGLGPLEIRKRNFIPAGAMPYTTPMGAVYDSGDFAATLGVALRYADLDGAKARQTAARAKGMLYGVGLAYYLEVTANAPQEAADIRFLDDGRVIMAIGTGPSGQGHETAFAQVLADKLGLPFDAIEFRFGDSDDLTQGGGTGGAKTLMLAGTAIVDASEKIIAKGRKLAGQVLEAAEEDIVFDDGDFAIAGTDRRIDVRSLAARAKTLPKTEGLPESLDEIGKSTTSANTFPNGCHVVEVAIDPDTGAVKVERYSVIDDFGLVVNPMIVKGQAHGGIAQGIGQALLEEGAYDPDSGQMLAGSFQDYAMPHADDLPLFRLDFNNVPCTTNSLGIKGAGEAGSVGALAAVMNAVHDALRPAGVKHVDMPASPNKVWAALRAAQASIAV